MIGKLKIDTHGSNDTADWSVQLNGVEISDFTSRIEITCDAMEVPKIRLMLLAELDIPSEIEGYISAEKVERADVKA